jgi:diacylglycerol kinase family enzyme
VGKLEDSRLASFSHAVGQVDVVNASASSIVVILNAGAGAVTSRPAIAAELRNLFQASGRHAEIITLRPGQDPTEAARSASAHAAIVVAGGGDGTVGSVAAGIVRSSAALGVLPLGTLNHFAKDLHIPLDLPGAVGVIASGNIGRVDVGTVNDRVFVNNSSIGVYPDIVQEREALRQRGYRKWPAMAIATLRVVRQYRGIIVTIDVEGQVRSWRTPFVVVGNNEYSIDGFRIGARRRLDAGRLFVYVSPRARTRDLPVLLAQALAGRASRSGAFEISAAIEARIDAWKLGYIPVATDGEVATLRMPLVYRLRPGALRVVVPPA